MSKNLNISVLVAARDEYIEQLKCIVVPMLIQGFNSIYQDAIKLSENKRTIWKFQELLKQIPQWNQTILQEESKRIKKKCPYIMDIVTAIFVTNVKILASVRLKGNRDDIRVKIPTSDIFIHSIYIESAQQIFYDPFLFHHRNNFGKIQENKYHVKQIISSSTDETIRQMLPFDDILQKYLADALNDNAEFGEENSSENGSVSDSDEESITDGDLPSEEEEDEEEPAVKSFNLNEQLHESNSAPFAFTKDENETGSDSDSDDEPSTSQPEQFQPQPPEQFQPQPPQQQIQQQQPQQQIQQQQPQPPFQSQPQIQQPQQQPKDNYSFFS